MALKELVELKTIYQEQGTDFIDKLTLMNFELLKEIEAMREKITDIDFTVNVKTAKLASHENNITELL